MTETLNDCSWLPLCVNYCGQSVVGRRFQQWSWPILLLSPAGRYLLSVPLGNMRQYSASLIATSHINRHKIISWAECKAEAVDMIFMIAVVQRMLGSPLYHLLLFRRSCLVIQLSSPKQFRESGCPFLYYCPTRGEMRIKMEHFKSELSKSAFRMQSIAFRFLFSFAAVQTVVWMSWYSEHNQGEQARKTDTVYPRGSPCPWAFPLSSLLFSFCPPEQCTCSVSLHIFYNKHPLLSSPLPP